MKKILHTGTAPAPTRMYMHTPHVIHRNTTPKYVHTQLLTPPSVYIWVVCVCTCFDTHIYTNQI